MTKYKSLSDQALIDLLNKDDEVAFEELYTRYWPSLYQSAYNILRDKSGCMDVLQEVFIWLWEHKGNLIINNTKAYLFSAVKYKVANYIRKGKARQSLFTELEITDLNDLPFYDDGIEVKELKTIITQFTAQLPDRAKQVFYLSRTEHLSNKEIAQRLGISEKTVENQMTTNLKKLRVLLGRFTILQIFFM